MPDPTSVFGGEPAVPETSFACLVGDELSECSEAGVRFTIEPPCRNCFHSPDATLGVRRIGPTKLAHGNDITAFSRRDLRCFDRKVRTRKQGPAARTLYFFQRVRDSPTGDYTIGKFEDDSVFGHFWIRRETLGKFRADGFFHRR